MDLNFNFFQCHVFAMKGAPVQHTPQGVLHICSQLRIFSITQTFLADFLVYLQFCMCDKMETGKRTRISDNQRDILERFYGRGMVGVGLNYREMIAL